MPDQPDDITLLRKAHYALEDLPDTIALAQPAESGGAGADCAVAAALKGEVR